MRFLERMLAAQKSKGGKLRQRVNVLLGRQDYLFLKAGLRFSANADIPSF